MHKYVIEREIPSVGKMTDDQFCAAAAKSNGAISELAPAVQWVESYVADDRLFCVYLAENEELVQRHAKISGFPATRIVSINRTIDPLTANGA